MAAIRNRIYIGSREEPIFYFENDSILSADVVQRVALVGTELSVDSFTPVVMDDEENLHDIYHFRSSDGQEIVDALGETFCIDMAEGTNLSPLAYLENGTPVLYFQENTLIGRFYLKSVERVGRNQYQLNTVSAIGMLDEMDHGGGLFTATTFGAVLAHILASGLHGTGDPVIPYVIDQEVAYLPVNGYLPHDTKRNNLYQLIFANGVNIVKNVDSRDEYNGVPRFTFLYSSPDGAEPVAQIYNEGSVDYNKPYTNVVVMEHTYTPVTTEVPVTLFDNTTGTAANNTEVWFDQAPVIVSSITATGLTLISATENSAVVSGNGTLTGIPYLHDTRTINMGDSGASDEKTIRVENATFVNLINSENLLRRLYAFYCPEHFIHKISDGIVYENIVVDGISHDPPRCGKVYRLKDPYGKEETAYLSSMNITASAINKAECEWYAGYVPVGQSGLYDHVDVLLPYWDEEEEEWVYEGEWEVPDDVTEIKVVIIGGGTGGGSGWPGENGQDGMSYTEVESTADLSAVWYGAEGGEGGAGGSGGTPGRIKIVTLSVTPGDTFSYALGQGGQGGAATGFIPDTVAELRAALENEDPDTEYTDAQIEAMVAQEDTDWSGTPNAGTAGTASSFGSDSSADPEGYVPAGGFYDSINDHYYALAGYGGIHGGKGGARQVKSGTVYTWITDGEDVVGDDGTVYRGGSTGRILTDVSGLSEATGKIKAYGGNGAGAAVGIGRDIVTPQTGLLLHPHINGGSDQVTSWDITVDSEWQPPEDRPTPPAPPSPSYQPITATLAVDKTTVEVGETITWTASATGGDGEYTYFFTVMYEDDVVAQHGEWQASNSVIFTPTQKAKYYVAGFVNDNRGTGMARIENGCMVNVEVGEEVVPESNPFPSDPEPETPGEIGYVEATATTDIVSGVVGDTITWTITPTVGSGNYEYYIQVRVVLADCGEDIYIDQSRSNSYTFTTRVQGDYYCDAIVRDEDTKHLCHSFSETVHIGADPNDTTWSNASSEKIVQLIQAAHRGEINLYNDLGWRVGDERIVYVKSYDLKNKGFYTSGEFHKIAISSFENYNGCGNVLQFDFTTVSTSYMYWPSQYASGTNSYRYSKIYTWYCPNCVEALPNWLKGLLLQFSVVASKSGGSVTEMVEGNKLAFRSASEVYGQAHNSVAYEGDQIDLYKNSYYRLKDRADNDADFIGWSRMGDWGLRSIHSREEYCIPDWITGEPDTKDKNAFVDFAPFGCI